MYKWKVGIEIKVRKQVASYLAKKLIATHCKFMQTQFQLSSYMDAFTNERYSNLQNLTPHTLAGLYFLSAKVCRN